jgi:hypothetical protein
MNTPRRTPEWLLERIALGELPADELERCHRELLAEPDGAERLAALEQSNQDILARYPAAEFSQQQRRRKASKAQTWWRNPLFLAPAASAMAALAVLAIWEVDLPWTQSPSANSSSWLERSKGLKPSFAIFRQRDPSDTPLREDAVVHAGDVLQLRYTAAGYRYGVLVSIDGRAQVTLHFPPSPAASTALNTQGEQLLDHAYELDDAPAFERFIFVVHNAPIDVAVVLAAARTLAKHPARALMERLDVDDEMLQTSLRLRKERP